MMTAKPRPQHDGSTPDEREEWVRVPAVIDANGDKIATLYDERGRPHTRLLAEVVLEAFVGPKPPGHVVRFKDGDRLNCALDNLEWIVPPPVRDEARRAKAIATRERADAIRKALEGWQHSDSAELIARDRER